MQRYVWLAGLLLVLLVGACDDEPGGTGNNGDGGSNDAGDGGGGDGGPADQGGGDGTPDQGGGDNGGTDNGGGDNGGGDGGGGGAFISCVVNPSGEQCGNGLDDDCDGRVDEGCSCFGDDTQSCYLGAPGDLDAEDGICQAGNQTCGLEFWEECTGAVGPQEEDCLTAVDDNCNGEVNEGCEQVGPTALCSPDFEGPVLSTYLVEGCYEEGENPVATMSWRVVSAPPGHSFDLRTFTADAPSAFCADVNPHNIEFFADVAGGYTYEFTVTDTEGLTGTCTTDFVATTADVIRVELSWNPDYQEGVGLPRDRSDFDLYLLQDPPDESNDTWYYYRDPGSGFVCSDDDNQDSCHWTNCATCPDMDDCTEGEVTYFSLDADPSTTQFDCDTDYLTHDCQRLTDREVVRECLCRDFLSNPPEGTMPEDVWPPPILEWGDSGSDEDDPRLDLDDTEGKGPENINVRLPEAGTYRVAVHFFDADGFGTQDGNGCRTATAQIRVLCAGAVSFESEQVELMYDDGSNGRWLSDLWEVGDLELSYDGEDNPVCSFTAFGTEGDRQICKMDLATGGCESEDRACEGGQTLTCDD